MDCQTFEILGRWEIDRGPQKLHYDFWWNLPRDYMVSSEWGLPPQFENGTPEPADALRLPALLKGFGAVPPLISDIDLSLDDRFLYVACWGTGELRQYDVTDPMKPTLAGSVRIGGWRAFRGNGGRAGALCVAQLVCGVEPRDPAGAGALVAWAVYRYLGLRFLRRAWLNLDLVWGASLVIAGSAGVGMAL